MGYRVKIPEGDYLAGLNEATQKLQDFVDNLAESSGQGLADIALYILGEATQRAPVDTGNLRGSGYVDLDGQSYAKVNQEVISKEEAQRGVLPPPGEIVVSGAVPDGTTRAEVGFNAKYAADQHEQVHLTHKQGQSKYLESVIVDAQGDLQEILINRLQRVMMGGGDND